MNKYWNLTDEELLKEAYQDENCGDLAHELATRLQIALDAVAEDDTPVSPWIRTLADLD